MGAGSVAWGDESLRIVKGSKSDSFYILAVTVPSSEIDLGELRKIKRPGMAKLHWRDMHPSDQRRSIAEIASMDATHIVIAARGVAPDKQERARAKCLDVLLPVLEARGVSLVILESRGELNDARDVKHRMELRVTGAISEIRVDHARASDDETLWIPDQIAGAWRESKFSETETVCWGMIAGGAEVIEFDL